MARKRDSDCGELKNTFTVRGIVAPGAKMLIFCGQNRLPEREKINEIFTVPR